MKYFGNKSDIANSNEKTGVLLTNLGSPDRPVCPSLRRYLSEFLQDARIIELPRFFRWLLVKGIIINFRAHKSARAYRQIWTEEGSPLVLNTAKLAVATKDVLDGQFVVEFGMRYGNPSIESSLRRLHQAGVRKIIVLPLYPQYSGSTNGSTFDAVANALKKFRWVPSLQFIDSYYQNPLYIEAITNSIKQHWDKHGKAQKLLLSFHGVPQKYVTQGDPYQAQCEQTAGDIARTLNLKTSEWMLVFQSRFGAEQWLQPYCDKTLQSLPEQGIKSIDIICPGFSADCLETLEEIDEENRDYFLQAGGESYRYIPCLNADQDHATLISDIVTKSA